MTRRETLVYLRIESRCLAAVAKELQRNFEVMHVTPCTREMWAAHVANLAAFRARVMNHRIAVTWTVGRPFSL